ncbi:hypothetical protein LINGRAHAP2_LOCUS37078 [Linum grandiflorum]
MVVGFKIFLTKNKGFHIFAGSYGILYNHINRELSFEGIRAAQPWSWIRFQLSKPSEYLSKKGLKSPDTIMYYLADYGVDVKSVKIADPKFPRHIDAKNCHYTLRSYAEAASEKQGFSSLYLKDLEKYCGIVIKE